MNNREKYEHLERDNDGYLYWFMNRDIKSIYDDDNMENIKDIFNEFEKQIDNNSYYIIGNYLYFTFNNNKYYHSPSDFEDEINHIDSLIEKLKEIGCKDFYYNCGRLD